MPPLISIPPTHAFFAALVNSSSDAIISKDLNGIITSWNKAAERIFGYTVAEAIGQPVSMLFPPDRVQEEDAILARIRAGELIQHYESVRRRKDGALIDVAVTISPILDESGVIVGASKVARDVTRQKREQALMHTTLSSIGEGVIATDEQGRITFINPAAEALIRRSRSEVLGKALAAVLTLRNPGGATDIASMLAAAVSGAGQVASHSAMLVQSDDAPRQVEFTVAPVREGSGPATGVVLVLRDVHAQREAEIAANRLAAIVQGSDDAIVSKNLRGIVTSWNPGAERVFGYTAAEMIGQSITRVIPTDRLDEEQQILARLQRGDRVDHFQTIRRRKDGQLIHVSLTISPVRDRDGRIVGASKIARDITELKLAQERLESHAAALEAKVRERTARLEETVAELEAFSYSLSHDMRAPLRAMQSFAEIVIEDYGDKIPEGVGYLRKVVANAERLDRLIRDVLNFARVSRADIQISPVDLDRLVDGILRERPDLKPAGATITVEHPLGAVMGNEASLTQCLANLLDNAVKFARPDVPPEVRIFTERLGDTVRICVADNGIGIDADGQQRLFGLFTRLKQAQGYGGTGIGLAIVRRAAQRMHGSVGVQSSPGLGSTFWIELRKA